MAEHSVCCTCGNIIRVRGARPGDDVSCSRCGRTWPVPVTAPPQRKAAPRRVVRHARRSSRLVVPAAGIAIAAIVVVILAVPRTPDEPQAIAPPPPEPSRPAAAATPDAAKPADVPPRVLPSALEEARKPATGDPQANLDLQLYRLNTAAIVARILELRGAGDAAAELRADMAAFAAQRDETLAHMRGEGRDPHVPDHCRPDDVILHVDRHELAKLSPAAADRALSAFVASIRAGSRARVVVRRGGDVAEFDLVYHTRPKELQVILQRADIVPAAGDERTTGCDGLTVLVNAARRATPSERIAASQDLAAKAGTSAVLAVAAHYLAFDDARWDVKSDGLQTYFDAARVADVAAFDAGKHLSALGWLAVRLPDVRAKDPGAARMMSLFAAAHAGDASRLGAGASDVARAAAAAGLAKCGDVWGDDVSALQLQLAREAVGARLSGTLAKFDAKFRNHPEFGVRFLAAYQILVETIERNSGGYDKLVAALRAVGRSAPAGAAEQLEALAANVERLGRCAQCENGRIKCPKCGGDGKADVKCPECDGAGRYEKNGGMKMCPRCNGKGLFRDVACGCVRTGCRVECPGCRGKLWFAQAPDASLTRVLTLGHCARCDGRGTSIERVALPCVECHGLGRRVVPAQLSR